MITAEEIRNKEISASQNGYDKNEVNALLDQAADTVDAYVAENQELYRKMEVLASKIDEYRSEEDLIKSAIIKAEKIANQVKCEADEKAATIIADSEAKAKASIDAANVQADQIIAETKQKVDAVSEELAESKEKADKIVAEARDYAAKIIKEKTDEGDKIIADAEKKANEAISSAKVISQDILDQARSISEDIIAKSNEQKEAYDLLINSVKNDAKAFIKNVKALYSEQIEALDGAKLETNDEEMAKNDESIANIQKEVQNLVLEIDEVEQSIPDSIYIDKTEPVKALDEEAAPESEPVEEAIDFEEIVDDEDDDGPIVKEQFELDEQAIPSVDENDDVDPLDAVKAFSQNEITPIDTSAPYIPEINDDEVDFETPKERSLFDEEEALPFENYFNVKRENDPSDRTQTISLVPPEEDDYDDDEPKFKGFFKKKK